MKKAVIKLKDGSHINIAADTFEFDKGMVFVKSGADLVAIVKIKDVISCHISTQN